MKKTKLETEKTKRKIVKTAIELFSELGVETCTLQQIAKNMGATRGAIYWHFKNKQELINYIINDYKEKEIKNIQKLAEETNSNIDLLVAYGLWTLDKKNSDELAAKIDTILYNNIQALLNIGVDYDVDGDINFIADIISKGIKVGEFKTDFSAKEISCLYLSHIYGMHLMNFSSSQVFLQKKYKSYLENFFKVFI